MAMICQYYGKQVSLEKMRAFAGTDNQGTNLWGLVQLGEKLGFEMTGVEAESVENLVEVHFPCIAHIINKKGFEHYIIIEKITKNEVFIVDPDQGRYKEKKEAFEEYWTKILLLIEKRNDFSQESDRPSVSKLFIDIFKVNHGFVWLLLTASIIINIFGFASTFYFKFLVDDIIPTNIIYNLHLLSIAVLIMYVTQSLTTYFRYQLVLHLSLRVDIQLMLDYYQHILNLPMNFFESRKSGEILSRFMDTNKVREAFSSVSVTMFVDVLMIVIGTILLYLQSKTLFIITLAFVPVYIILALAFRKPYKKFNRQQMEQNAELNNYLIETVQGMSTIKSYNAESQVFVQAEGHFIRLIKKYLKLGALTNIQMSIKEFLSLLTSLLILWVGSGLVIKGEMTLGELLTFNALVIYFFGPIERMIDAQPVIQSAIVAARRVVDITALPIEEVDNKVSLSQFEQQIIIDKLSFHYGQREDVLKEITMKIPKGKFIAIVGESGSGKSTLAKLLVNFYQPQKGTVKLDGFELKEIKNISIRQLVGYLSQNSFCFSGSILENLTLGLKENVQFHEIKRACELAEAHQFIEKLPQGYYSMLETNGDNLSGGQLQRLALARLLIHSPEILVLDEATSALDTITEKNILNNLDDLVRKGLTVLMISHKISAVENADYIYCMKDGVIVESGKHQELINNNKFYYQLWINQSAKGTENES